MCVRTYVREHPADQKVSCVRASWHGAPAGSAARFSVPVSPNGPPVSPLRLRRHGGREAEGDTPTQEKTKDKREEWTAFHIGRTPRGLIPLAQWVFRNLKRSLDFKHARRRRSSPTSSLSSFLIYAAFTPSSIRDFSALFIYYVSVINPNKSTRFLYCALWDRLNVLFFKINFMYSANTLG